MSDMYPDDIASVFTSEKVEELKAKMLELKAYFLKVTKESIWKNKGVKHNVEINTTKLEDSDFKAAYCRTKFEYPFERIREYMIHRDMNINESTPKEDSFSMKVRIPVIVKDDWLLIYQCASVPIKIVKDRHCLLFMWYHIDEEDHSLWVLSSSNGLNEYLKEDKKHIPMSLKININHIYPDHDAPDARTCFDMLVDVQPNGSVPASCYNLAINQQAEFFGTTLRLFEKTQKH